MTREFYEEVRAKALPYYEKAHIALTDKEKEGLEIVDFGMQDNFYNLGICIITYVNNERYCGKEMMLFPHQTGALASPGRYRQAGDVPLPLRHGVCVRGRRAYAQPQGTAARKGQGLFHCIP